MGNYQAAEGFVKAFLSRTPDLFKLSRIATLQFLGSPTLTFLNWDILLSHMPIMTATLHFLTQPQRQKSKPSAAAAKTNPDQHASTVLVPSQNLSLNLEQCETANTPPEKQFYA